MEKGISIIICCYNSANRLEETLRHIALQDIENDINYEIIIVDNSSTDNTQEIAKKQFERYPFFKGKFNIAYEPIQGLSAARQKGIEVARYEYALFCDDDNWLSPDYVKLGYEIMEENKDIGVLGGASVPVADIELPSFFYSKCSNYAIGIQSETSGDISNRGYVWGSSSIVRTLLLKKIYLAGIKPVLSGRNGKVLMAGDDAEICKWYLLSDYKLWYDSRLQFKHYIPEYRLNESYASHLFIGLSESAKILIGYDYHIFVFLYKYQKTSYNSFRKIYLILKRIYFYKKINKKEKFLIKNIVKKINKIRFTIYSVVLLRTIF